MNDYEKQASDFLTKHNLEFRAVLIGDDCPRFCDDAAAGRDMDKVTTFPRKTHIHGKHYRCTISGKGRGHVSFDFWNSYADEEWNWVRKNRFGAARDTWINRNFGRGSYTMSEKYAADFNKNRKAATVSPYDLLACVEKYDPGHFEEFCSGYGYDADSRRAEETWKSVMEEWRKVSRFFTTEEMAELQEIS